MVCMLDRSEPEDHQHPTSPPFGTDRERAGERETAIARCFSRTEACIKTSNEDSSLIGAQGFDGIDHRGPTGGSVAGERGSRDQS